MKFCKIGPPALIWLASLSQISIAELPPEPDYDEIARQESFQNLQKARPRKLLDIDKWQTLFTIKDYLAIRMGIKELLKSDQLRKREKLWRQLRELIKGDPIVGQDLRSLWDKLGPRNSKIQIILEKRLADADQYYEKYDFKRAETVLIGIAKSLVQARHTSKVRYQDTQDFELYLKLALARTLYSAGDFKKSALAYSAIPSSFYDFPQVLFERIWANYRAGRNDWALGDLTSLMSGYFGRIPNPEVLIVGIYSAYELCQNKLADQLRRIYVRNLKSLRDDPSTTEIFGADPILLTLKATLENSEYIDKFSDLFSRPEREAETKRISDYLTQETAKQREALKVRYQDLLPYLASAPKIAPYLNKKKLASRSEIFQGPYNVTQIVKNEIWADEVGYFLYRPTDESDCSNGRPGFETEDNTQLNNLKAQKKILTRPSMWEFQIREVSKRMFFFPKY